MIVQGALCFRQLRSYQLGKIRRKKVGAKLPPPCFLVMPVFLSQSSENHVDVLLFLLRPSVVVCRYRIRRPRCNDEAAL